MESRPRRPTTTYPSAFPSALSSEHLLNTILSLASLTPSPICPERSEEPAVRLEPSPIPKGKHTANPNRAYLSPDTTVSISGHILFIRSVPGFPAPPLSPATPDVVLFKENHTQQTEAAILDRKSGEAERICCAPFGCPTFLVLQSLTFVILWPAIVGHTWCACEITDRLSWITCSRPALRENSTSWRPLC